MRIEQEPSFILHQRAYSETSIILDIFSKNYGRMSLLAKGAKRQTSSKGSLLNQFQLLSLSWTGRSDLKTLTNVESLSEMLKLDKNAVYCGFYINELIVRLLHQHDPHPELFDYYHDILLKISRELSEETLRIFEKRLLIEIGYGVVLDRDIDNNAIDINAEYHYLPEQGPVKVSDKILHNSVISGRSLMALANEDIRDAGNMTEIKRLMRALLQKQLGEKPLRSRQLMNDLMAISREQKQADD